MKALHLAPQQGSSWGDLGATFYHEAQLRRAHPRLDPSQAKPLRAAAEKLMRGSRVYHLQQCYSSRLCLLLVSMLDATADALHYNFGLVKVMLQTRP